MHGLRFLPMELQVQFDKLVCSRIHGLGPDGRIAESLTNKALIRTMTALIQDWNRKAGLKTVVSTVQYCNSSPVQQQRLSAELCRGAQCAHHVPEAPQNVLSAPPASRFCTRGTAQYCM